jgi:hypothetical protein
VRSYVRSPTPESSSATADDSQFINVQWQLTGTPGEPSLELHLGYMLTTASIAIAFAIPFQLMLFPIHAREELRNATAQNCRRPFFSPRTRR